MFFRGRGAGPPASHPHPTHLDPRMPKAESLLCLLSENIKRRFGPPDEQSRSDKQLLIFDAFERMSGYTYFGIIDHDEFLFPSKNRSLKHLLVG